MENKYSQFRNISIKKDLPIFFTSEIYNNIDEYFEKLGIETLEDLFAEYDKGTFNDKRKKFNKEIKGQTRLLMYYYMGTPLNGTEVLNEEIPNDNIHIFNDSFFDKKYEDELNFIGITNTELGMIYSYCVHEINITDVYKPTLLDIMKDIIKDDQYLKSMVATTNYDSILKTIRNLIFKINFFETYKKFGRLMDEEDVSNISDGNMKKKLEEQKQLLLRSKQSIEKQLSQIENQINNIDNAKNTRKQYTKK